MLRWLYLIFTCNGEDCAEETECCGGHGTKVSRLSKAYGCDRKADIVLPRGAPTRLADDILQAYLVHPVQSEGRAELLRPTLFCPVLNEVSRISVSRKFYRGNRGVCVTIMPLIADQPLYFAQRPSIYSAHGAKHAAMSIVMSAVLMWLMLFTIMNEISLYVLSRLNWPTLNWPELNWHSANLPVLLLTVVSAGATFLFSLERLAL